MPDITALPDFRRRTLNTSLVKASRALARSALPLDQRRAVSVQLDIINSISKIAIPDWAHVHSLVIRLLLHLGDRAPAVSAELRGWADQNDLKHRTYGGNWRP